MCERSNAPVARFCQSIGCWPTSCYQWKRKLAAKPQTSVFLRVLAIRAHQRLDREQTPRSRREAGGDRRKGTAAYHSPLTPYVALWAFRGVGCAPKSSGLRTPAVLVPPSGLLRVLGGGRTPVAYAHRQRSAALRAEAKQPDDFGEIIDNLNRQAVLGAGVRCEA